MAAQPPISYASSPYVIDTQTYDFANLVFLNVATQAPIRLTPVNFFTRKAQWDAILYGYALTSYVDSSLPCPSSSSNLAYLFWTHQDQLIFRSLFASLSHDLASMVASAKTSRTRSITVYMVNIKAATEELALLNEPLKVEEVKIYVLNGLNSDLKEISAALRSRDTEISFKDLHERLLEYEAYIHKFEPHTPEDAPMIAYVANTPNGPHPFTRHPQKKSGSKFHSIRHFSSSSTPSEGYRGR
ncbi:uncharacterized protein LOC107425787 [Ziziphus jujuba]|uniref:Uncharacterized protein LOC107425787 n=1 Tax=Ziziphus jujuba TaxID=326968 RepID=A0ABM3I4P3_ZIZJJ|nr:uncharacterized protein LOC107425787 [Ziziphus jujuba]